MVLWRCWRTLLVLHSWGGRVGPSYVLPASLEVGLLSLVCLVLVCSP